MPHITFLYSKRRLLTFSYCAWKKKTTIKGRRKLKYETKTGDTLVAEVSYLCENYVINISSSFELF